MQAEVRAIGGDGERCSWDCKHGSGEGVAVTCIFRENPIGTSRSDVKGSTGKILQMEHRGEVANPYSGPVSAKIFKSSGESVNPPKLELGPEGASPPKPTLTAEGPLRSRP